VSSLLAMVSLKIGMYMSDPAYKVMTGIWGSVKTWRLHCFWCEAPIVLWGGRSGQHYSSDHHHRDEALHADPQNIIPMHRSCHVAHHHSLESHKYPKWNVTRSTASVIAGGQRLNANLTHEQRVTNGRKSWDTRGDEGQARSGALVKQRWMNPTYKMRVSSAVKAGQARRSQEERSAAAHKAWATKRARQAEVNDRT
jgi:hypothetical protein